MKIVISRLNNSERNQVYHHLEKHIFFNNFLQLTNFRFGYRLEIIISNLQNWLNTKSVMTLVIQATVRGAAPKLVGLENDDGPGSKNKNRALFFEATADLKVVASNPFVLSLTQQYGYFFSFVKLGWVELKKTKGSRQMLLPVVISPYTQYTVPTLERDN